MREFQRPEMQIVNGTLGHRIAWDAERFFRRSIWQVSAADLFRFDAACEAWLELAKG